MCGYKFSLDLRLVSFVLVLSFVLPCAFATEPFSNSCISKDEHGNWAYPHMFTGDFLFIEEGTNQTRLSLKEIFPDESYAENVHLTTAGPLWGEPAFYYVFTHEGTDYFHMWCPSGKRVLLNLTDPKVDDPGPLLTVIIQEDRARVTAFLEESAKIATDRDKGLRWEKVYAGMLLAAEYGLTNAVPSLRVLEEHSWQGPACSHQGSYKKTFGLNEDVSFYQKYDGRRYAQLALRRLGYKPAGYRANVFDDVKINNAISPDDRKKAASKIVLGITARDVYDLMGPPDYMISTYTNDAAVIDEQLEDEWYSAWRYDFDAPEDYSLILAWDEKDGRLEQALTVTPALWRGAALFPDASDPFNYDGALNGVFLYSQGFSGEVKVSKRPKR